LVLGGDDGEGLTTRQQQGGFAIPSLTSESEDESGRLLIEQALATTAGLRQTAPEAPNRAVLAACEAAAVEKGRTLTASALEDAT
jgi:hypothetical protein